MLGHNHPPIEQMTRNERIQFWDWAKENLAQAKKAEADLRDAVMKDNFPQPQGGVNKLDIGNGYGLKAQVNMTYSFDKDLAVVQRALARIHPDRAAKLVKWEHKLDVTEFKLLTDEEQNLISEAIIIKAQSPSLELTKPQT